MSNAPHEITKKPTPISAPQQQWLISKYAFEVGEKFPGGWQVASCEQEKAGSNFYWVELKKVGEA
jgi:hypothetical protein